MRIHHSKLEKISETSSPSPRGGQNKTTNNIINKMSKRVSLNSIYKPYMNFYSM